MRLPEEAVRFAVLGDSLTEGLGDPRPGGGWRGWAVLLADGIAAAPGGVDLLNCARSGALTHDVLGEQLALARAHRPHLAAVIAGANDTLRGAFDIGEVAVRLDAVFGALRADGATLLTACLPDPGRMLGLPWPLARPLARRMQALNDVVHALSDRYEAVHVHVARDPWIGDRASWSVDRLHPSELGHRLLARAFHLRLAAHGLALGPPPSTRADGPAPTRAASAWWMATKGTGWVVDRCTDLLPGLMVLAAEECRHRLRGTDHLLHARSRAAVRAALARTAPPPTAPPRTAPTGKSAATMSG